VDEDKDCILSDLLIKYIKFF